MLMIPDKPLTSNSEPKLDQHLNERHRRDLAASGITAELAQSVGIRSASEREVQTLLGRSDPVGSGMVIPYPDPMTPGRFLQTASRKGGTSTFVRIRLDDPSRAPDRDGKPAKYLSRVASGQQPYIVPTVADAIRRGTEPIFLAEGEKKSLCASAHGIPTIGLSGNFGWKVKDKQELLPLLDRFLPAEHTVVIVWDSDAAINTAFAVSTRMLHDILQLRRCAVKVVVLPQNGLHKVGLDDYLVANGAESFKKLVADTPALPGDRQVSIPELLLMWVTALAPALKTLPVTDAEALLTGAFQKGLVDRVDHGTRQTVLKILGGLSEVDVDKIFKQCVADHLKANYGDSSTAQTASPIAVGDLATLPDERATRVKVIATEDGVAWVRDAKAKKDAAVFPVPPSALRDIATDSGHDAVPSPAELADSLLKQEYIQDGITALRCHRDVFYQWEMGSYNEVPENDIRAEAMGFLRRTSPKLAQPKTQTAVIANLKAAGVCYVPSTVEMPCWIDGTAFKPATDIISFTNGNLDIAALQHSADDQDVWLPPTPSLLTVTGRPYAFDEKADCPRWKAFLEEMLPDADVRGLVQELFGLCQVHDTKHHRFFLFHGTGDNGKGVLSDVLMATVGTANVSTVPLSRFGERFSLWPLTTCLVNLVAEMPGVDQVQSLRIAEDKLKAIVSGEFIEIERKNKDILKAKPTARLIFSCNSLPPVSDRSNGVWRRLLIVPFPVAVAEEKKNHDLAKEIIATELSGVMRWALDGLLRLRDRGHFIEPKISLELKQAHRRACAAEEDFLADHVTTGTAADFLVIGDAYAAYRTYAITNGNIPMSMRRFIEGLLRLFPKCAKGSRPVPGKEKARGYSGVIFHPNGIPEGDQS